MRALVTGSNGFIGSFLVQKLVEKKLEVRCFVRKTSNLRWLNDLPVNFAHGELSDVHSLETAVAGVDYVFHLAGLTKTKRVEEYFQANTDGTENLLRACKTVCPDLRKFVFVSSLAAAGPSHNLTPIDETAVPNPLTPYGKSKLAAEKIVMQHAQAFPVTIIRPPAVYGPRDIEMFEIFRTVKFGISPKLTGGDRVTNFIHVSDLVDGLILAAGKQKSTNNVYFLTGDGQFTWQDVCRAIADAMHKRIVQVVIPTFIFEIIAILNEMTAKITGKAATVNRYKVLEMKQRYWICDNTKIKQELGFKPKISFQEGIKQTVEWYQQAGWL